MALCAAFAGNAMAAPAVIATEFGCGLYDGDGGFVFTTDTKVTKTASQNGNSNMRCSASGVPNSQGQAVRHDYASTGALCAMDTQTGFVLTEDWHTTVSADGEATLICRYNAQQQP